MTSNSSHHPHCHAHYDIRTITSMAVWRVKDALTHSDVGLLIAGQVLHDRPRNVSWAQQQHSLHPALLQDLSFLSDGQKRRSQETPGQLPTPEASECLFPSDRLASNHLYTRTLTPPPGALTRFTGGEPDESSRPPAEQEETFSPPHSVSFNYQLFQHIHQKGCESRLFLFCKREMCQMSKRRSDQIIIFLNKVFVECNEQDRRRRCWGGGHHFYDF